MNIRFIILRAGGGYSREYFHFENYEIAWGSSGKGSKNQYFATEFATFEEAQLKLNELTKMFPTLNYRLAAVWD